MASNDEAIKLILQVTDSGTIEEAVSKLNRLKTATQNVADTYAIADQKGDQYVITTREITHAMDQQVAAAVEATMRQKALNQVMAEGGAQLNKFSGFMEQHKFRILEAGRAVQDFAQGGIAGILNNIERLVGGSGAMAGALTAVGVAAYIAWPYIKKWGEEMGAAGEKFDVPIKETDKLTEAIKKNKDAMAEMTKEGKLTYIQLLDYSKLVSDTTKMEGELATAREARLVKAGSSKGEQARAAAVRETIAERFGSSEDLFETIMGTEAGQQQGKANVERVMAGAQKGFLGDIRSVGTLLPEFKEAYAGFSPERQEQVKQAQEMAKQEAETLKRRAKKQEEADAEARRFNEQFDQERERKDDQIDAELERGVANMERIGHGATRARERRDVTGARNAQRQQKAQALERLGESKTGMDRMFEDQAYWDKFNSGMITVADQISRFKQIQARQIEDAQRAINHLGNQFNNGQERNEQPPMGGGQN